MMKKAQLYHGKVDVILLNDNPLMYYVLNHWHVVSVVVKNKARTLYESSKGYFVNLNGKRIYLDVVTK